MKQVQVIALAIAAVASGLGCKPKSTFVHVTLTPAQPEPSGIKSIELQLALGSQTAVTTLREADGRDIALPADTTLQIGSGSGQLSIIAVAKGADGRELDRGVTTATVVASAITEVSVAMAGGKANLSPSEDHHDFTGVAQGQSSTVNLSYINSGYKPTGTLTTALAGAGASAFSIGPDNCAGRVLAPSASCSVGVTFHPTTVGALAATVAVTGDPGGTGTVAVTGTGVAGTQSLTIATAGNGAGTLTSTPAGLSCTGGTCTGSFPYGSAVTIAAAQATGSSFVRWTGLSGCAAAATCVVALPQTGAASAVFTLNTETLTVAYAGSGSGSVSSTDGALTCATTGCTGSYLYGAAVTLRAAPSTGSTVAGWTGCAPSADSLTCAVSVGVSNSVRVTFGTAQEPLSVAFSGTGAGKVTSDDNNLNCNSDKTGTCTFPYPYGAVVNLQATAPSGSRFAGWSVAGCSTVGPCKVTLNAPLTVVASFVPTTTLILGFRGTGSGSVLATPGGTCNGSPSGCVFTVDTGSAVTLKATPATGSTFGGFAGPCAVSGDPASCNITFGASSQTVTSTFTLVTQPLSVVIVDQAASAGSAAVNGSVASSPAGISCPSGACSNSFPANTSVTLTASPGASSVFTGWSGGVCSGTNTTCTVTMSQAQAATANFASSTYSLTVWVAGSAGSGKITSSPAGVSLSAGQAIVPFAYGTVVTLSAGTTSSNVYFFGYTGDCSGQACTVRLDKDRSVTGSFHPNFCATSGAPVQEFSSTMQGCGGKVTYANRAAVCAAGCHVASANEWTTGRAGGVPTHQYWTDDALLYSSSGGACGPGGCNSQQCFASLANLSGLTSACTAGQPMHVCSGGAADSDGNTCTWSGCGYNSIAPNQYFGGCSNPGDAGAGALCVCGQPVLYVDAVAGLDTNAGTSAAPFKTITHAMSVAGSGQTVQVRPGTYNGTPGNGEVFPIKLPQNVSLIGDEASRGTAPAGATTISGQGAFGEPTNQQTPLLPGAGSIVAGFNISAVGSGGTGVYLSGADGAIIRNNSINKSYQNAITVTSTRNFAILLNTASNSGSIGLDVGGTSSGGKVENNTFTGNYYGVAFDVIGADAGGGPAGSVGNNVISCNSGADVETNQSGQVPVANNKWDHQTPSQLFSSGLCSAGTDLCQLSGAFNFLTTGASQAPAPCP